MQPILTFQRRQIGWCRPTRSVVPPLTAITITLPLIGPQDGTGNVLILYTTTQDTACDVILFPASQPFPQVGAFGGSAPADYRMLGTVVLTQSATGLTLTIPDGLVGSYRLALLPQGGSDVDIVVSPSVALNTVMALTFETAQQVISVDSESVGTTASTTPFTASAGTNRLLVGVVTYSQGPAPSAVSLSLGAQAFTQAHDHGSTTGGLPKSHVFYILDTDIPSGAQTVTFTPTGNNVRDLTVTLIELTGVDQASPIGATELAATLSNFTSATNTITTTQADSMILSVISTGSFADETFGIATDSGETPVLVAEHTAITSMRQSAVSLEKASAAGAVENTWSWSSMTRYYMRQIEIKAVF